MKRGEVRWYVCSRPDKKRPDLILTRDSALEFLGEVTVAPITSTIRDIPSEVLLTSAEGMPRDCAVNLDHVQTVSKGKIGSLIATTKESDSTNKECNDCYAKPRTVPRFDRLNT
jgi:mRNA interferase MazF